MSPPRDGATRDLLPLDYDAIKEAQDKLAGSAGRSAADCERPSRAWHPGPLGESLGRGHAIDARSGKIDA
jgi:hypothetical protein